MQKFNTMKKIEYNNAINNGFFIKKNNNKIYITTFGYIHAFTYPSILIKEIHKLSKSINKDEIEVYFNSSSILGEDALNKYFVILYDKNKKDFIYPSKKTINNLIGD